VKINYVEESKTEPKLGMSTTSTSFTPVSAELFKTTSTIFTPQTITPVEP